MWTVQFDWGLLETDTDSQTVFVPTWLQQLHSPFTWCKMIKYVGIHPVSQVVSFQICAYMCGVRLQLHKARTIWCELCIQVQNAQGLTGTDTQTCQTSSESYRIEWTHVLVMNKSTNGQVSPHCVGSISRQTARTGEGRGTCASKHWAPRPSSSAIFTGRNLTRKYHLTPSAGSWKTPWQTIKCDQNVTWA